MNDGRRAFRRASLFRATSILRRMPWPTCSSAKRRLVESPGLGVAEGIVVAWTALVRQLGNGWLRLSLVRPGVAAQPQLRMAGEQFAGSNAAPELAAGDCIRITTGAPLPPGADTVVMKENTRVENGFVHVASAPARGGNVRGCGEDVRAGECVLSRGCVLSPAALSLIAALGDPQVMAIRRPTVAVFTTGDELQSPGMPLGRARYTTAPCPVAGAVQPTAWNRWPGQHYPMIARMEAALRDAAFLSTSLSPAVGLRRREGLLPACWRRTARSISEGADASGMRSWPALGRHIAVPAGIPYRFTPTITRSCARSWIRSRQGRASTALLRKACLAHRQESTTASSSCADSCLR